jgi:hypothetical protein
MFAGQTYAQVGQSSSSNQSNSSEKNDDSKSGMSKKNKTPSKPKIPSHIKTWQVNKFGSEIKRNEMDTTLSFYHVYHPIFQKSISNTFIGNNGGAYISNDFFNRSQSDFYFVRSYDAYFLTPSGINYMNTTTPYSMLDYSQSENSTSKNETRFNVFLSQNVNKKFNFEFIFNQTKATGQYLYQANKFHNVALVTSYLSDKIVSHSNIIFNQIRTEENGGLASDQDFGNSSETENYVVNIDDAVGKVQNYNIITTNEYRLGKTVKSDSVAKSKARFIPRVGFIHQLEISGNERTFTKTDATSFFKNTYTNTSTTSDKTTYTRITNIFQIKAYEAPDRNFTFGKRVYIGNDQLMYNFSESTGYFPKKQSNVYVGGGIFRREGKFWQWEAEGKIYIVGYRAGQTELSGLLNKPLRIGSDTTSFRIEGWIKTIVPDYYQRYFYSNHFQWSNSFKNIKDMTIRSSIHSQEFKTTIGMNYSLIGNYIYNDTDALPAQAGSELLVLSGYINKDFETDHWLIRLQALVQKSNNDNVVHLPTFAGFASLNFRTIVSKVLHFQLGADTHYNSAFYADAYEPATARFYLQSTQSIGKYPFIDLHANMKLKRTRFFFLLMNAGAGIIGGNKYFMAPDYPYYYRTYRIGIAWSFYD